MRDTAPGAALAPPVMTLWGHPKGLPVLISLKVWELFSYQGMRAFLVFYLIDAFGMHDGQAALVFGSYAALVLATSVFGGYCADRWLGARQAMAMGAALIMAGHCTLAVENVLAGLQWATPASAFQVFCAGLGLIAVGTGLLKPNVLTFIGRLYRAGDPKRELGYYGYYIGVNIGSFAAPIVCGGLGARYGWGWGFGAAAIGMALGLVSYLLGRRWVRPAEEEGAHEVRASVPRSRVLLLLAAIVAVATLLVQNGLAVGVLLLCTLIVGIAILLVQARASSDAGDMKRVLRLFLLLPIPMFFEVLFELLSTTLNLFSDRAVEQSLFGLDVTAPQLLSLNSFFVLALLPVLAVVWSGLARRGREPAPFAKFAIGFALIGAAFVVLTVATGVGASDSRVPLAWIVAAYLLMTLGELCIAPPVLALVGMMVPERYAGVAMGLTLLCFAAGSFLSSLLAGAVAMPTTVSVAEARAAYGEFFLVPAAIALAFVVCALAFGRILRQRTGPHKTLDREAPSTASIGG